MKMMKLAFLAVALCVGSATVARAQDPQPQGQRAGRPNMTAMLFQGITLTPDQQAKVDSITTRYRDVMQKAREAGDREAMMAARQKQMDELKGVLTTDDQKTQFDKNVADMRSRMQRPPGQD